MIPPGSIKGQRANLCIDLIALRKCLWPSVEGGRREAAHPLLLGTQHMTFPPAASLLIFPIES